MDVIKIFGVRGDYHGKIIWNIKKRTIRFDLPEGNQEFLLADDLEPIAMFASEIALIRIAEPMLPQFANIWGEFYSLLECCLEAQKKDRGGD